VPSETERLDLYSARNDLLGPERAETLMAFLPTIDTSQLATKVDLKAELARLHGRIDSLEARMTSLEARMTSLEALVTALGGRLDRIYLTLVAGLLVIVAAMVGVIVSV
jgi:hypothetical protein